MSYSINKTKFLLTDELNRLERTIERNLITDTRNALLFGVALKTGARATELLNLKVSDINYQDKSLFIRGIKGSNDREIPINGQLFAALETHVQRTRTELVFGISYPRLVQIWDRYRPARKKFHSLRHTFAIELFKKHRDLRLVQMALGHRSINNTMVYANYVYSIEELKRLII